MLLHNNPPQGVYDPPAEFENRRGPSRNSSLSQRKSPPHLRIRSLLHSSHKWLCEHFQRPGRNTILHDENAPAREVTQLART